MELLDYAGNAVAMLMLLDSTVTATTRHSVSAPSAATPRSRGSAGTMPLGQGGHGSLPCRTTVSWCKSLRPRANHSRHPSKSARCHRQDCGGDAPRKRQKYGNDEGFARYLGSFPAIPDIQTRLFRRLPRGGPQARHRSRAANPSRQIRGSARPVSARRGPTERSRGRSRSGRRHGCSRTARCRRP